VLSEGLNLQDATRLINYDLHWNPVRLMQRIGRIDRRLNPDIEAQMIADHPELKEFRGKVIYWNFLPPEELDDILRLYKKVSHKTLRISKVFGIEGKKLLKPEDDYEAVKDFNHGYEGEKTALEAMHLEYQKLLAEFPDLEERLSALPGKIFSGKVHPAPGTRAVFFCYALPGAQKLTGSAGNAEDVEWTEQAGYTRWYLHVLDGQKTLTEPSEIVQFIRCRPDTPRKTEIPSTTLAEIRQAVEKEIKNDYLKKVQAPVGIKPALKAWMELN
jgi:hypothetical protein